MVPGTFLQRIRISPLAVVLSTSVLAASGANGFDDPSDIRSVIARSVPYLQEHGVSWIENRGCVSCHRVGMMVWSLNEAAAHGFEVDRTQLDEWTDWSLEALITEDDNNGDPIGTRNPEGMSQLLLSRRQQAGESAKRRQTYDAFVELLLNGQNTIGTWKPGGQLPQQKRPIPETTGVSTMWNALALLTVKNPTDDVRSGIQLAGSFVSKTDSALSTEWYVARLLLAVQLNEADDQARWLQALLSLQQDDGGWGWLTNEPSDALATGMALYAVSKAGTARRDPAVTAARLFLKNTQLEDGSWSVHGTKEKKKESFEETAGYWGTAWATIGLLETLPADGSPISPAAQPAEPAATPDD